jgi:invasion protein IalB
MTRTTQFTILAVVVVALVGAVAPAAAATSGTDLVAQTNNTTTTAPPTATATPADDSESTKTCEPRPGGPTLQPAKLYSPEPTITKDQHGKIAGSIALDIQNNCPVVVQITMTVPSGMYVAGAGDLQSGGGGIITSTFTVSPGEAKSLRANVYSNSVGDKTVTADITYYPKGHKEMAREIDGLMLSFDVQEKNMPGDPQPPETTQTTKETTTTPPDAPDNSNFMDKLLTLVGVTQIGLLVLVALGMLMITKAVPDHFDFDMIFGSDKK